MIAQSCSGVHDKVPIYQQLLQRVAGTAFYPEVRHCCLCLRSFL